MIVYKWFPWNFCSKNEKTTIMDMPYLVMTQILDNVGFLDILNLRKTCKSFRNFIDDVKPGNGLKKVDIFLEHHRLTVKMTFDNDNKLENGGAVTVMYKEGKEQNCCLISKTYKGSEKLIKTDGHFLDAFFHDFEPIFKNQRSKLTVLEIKVDSFIHWDIYSSSPQYKFQSIFSCCLCSRFKKLQRVVEMRYEANNHRHVTTASEMMDRLEHILKSRMAPLQVKNLDLTVFKPSQIFGILRFIKANSLKAFQAHKFEYREKEDTQVLDAVQKCQTLKSLEYLRIGGFVMTNPISYFLDIPHLYIKRETISKEDIMVGKQAFLTNCRLKNWQLKFQSSKNYDILNEVLGCIPDDQEEWFFKIPNSEDVLFISYVFGSISFTRIDLDDVPKNALIH